MNDNYTGQTAIFAGMSAPNVLEINAIAQGGTVNALAANVTASGFTLLSTAPTGREIWNNQPHSGACWDEERKCLWTFGAETHGVMQDYDNAVYVFDTRDGLFKKIYNSTVGVSEYNVNADGYLYADLAETLPWAVHTYNRLHYDAASRSIKIMMDGWFHSGIDNPILKGSITLANRRFPLWNYDTVTSEWTTTDTSEINSFNGINVQVMGAGYSDQHGWFGASSNGQALRRIDANGVYSETFLGATRINGRMHSAAFYMGNLGVIFSKDTATTGVLASFHPMNDIAASYTKRVEEFPILNGWLVTNRQAFPISETEFLFIAQDGTPQLAAFIYNVVNHTITDTGHRLTGVARGMSDYNFRGTWSASLNAAILMFNLFSGSLRTYLLRL